VSGGGSPAGSRDTRTQVRNWLFAIALCGAAAAFLGDRYGSAALVVATAGFLGLVVVAYVWLV